MLLTTFYAILRLLACGKRLYASFSINRTSQFLNMLGRWRKSWVSRTDYLGWLRRMKGRGYIIQSDLLTAAEDVGTYPSICPVVAVAGQSNVLDGGHDIVSSQSYSVDVSGQVIIHIGSSSTPLDRVAAPEVDCPNEQEEISEVIYPTTPGEYSMEYRYKNNRKIENTDAYYEVQPMQNDFSAGTLPQGWEELVHPEGQPFFYHAKKKILTESWMWDSTLAAGLMDLLAQIEDYTRAHRYAIPTDTHLVMNVSKAKDNRSLFWLEPYALGHLVKELRGGQLSPSHIKLILEREYWTFWETFPNVMHCSTTILEYASSQINDARTGEGRVLNYFGQYNARLSPSQSIHESEDYKRTWLVKILAPLLFNSPNIHLSTMEKLWVDKLTIQSHWIGFFNKLNIEWKGHTEIASLLLNANVAFLAIPSVDSGNHTPSSAVQIASYLSILTSSASLILSLLLVRQFKTREKGTVHEVADFLNKSNRNHGLENLAILFSLPYALLMWSMVAFLAAFLLLCVQNPSIWTRSSVAFVWLLMAMLILWCIRTSWDNQPDGWLSLFVASWKRIRHPYEGFYKTFRKKIGDGISRDIEQDLAIPCGDVDAKAHELTEMSEGTQQGDTSDVNTKAPTLKRLIWSKCRGLKHTRLRRITS
ncbi:hypothetical protein BDQ12DRAFT_739702 [Crucibulum laeve]|uniref:WW domain-containing protein n=1 Tax=Crucibulum laeve TaxID=68775 RepID=A0A5C3LGH1_9AGAR|nr:hypothetical protein BDQ12DRAFT_739702 [Crucibulum laeve]